jgi:hypothetical protein
MSISGGDVIRASVSVTGRLVTLSLADVTRRERFSQTIVADTLDVSSAEWIAEAPSECSSASQCADLPLADFRTVRFSGASALALGGRSGAISSPMWRTTRILLGYRRRGATFVSNPSSSQAVPSALGDHGRGFVVRYFATGRSTTQSTAGHRSLTTFRRSSSILG